MKGSELFIVLILSTMLVLGGVIVIDLVANAAEFCKEVRQPTWAPPDVSKCPKATGLWECIRAQSYRRDI